MLLPVHVAKLELSLVGRKDVAICLIFVYYLCGLKLIRIILVEYNERLRRTIRYLLYSIVSLGGPDLKALQQVVKIFTFSRRQVATRFSVFRTELRTVHGSIPVAVCSIMCLSSSRLLRFF